MACGTAANTYNTLDSLVLVLPSGTVLDTGAPDADERLRQLEPELYAGLDRLGDRVRGNPASVRLLEQQFSMKNTMGYGLNSFLDHTRPVDVLAHLVVGSEGTLAFVASVVMRHRSAPSARDDRAAGLRRPRRRDRLPDRDPRDRPGDDRAPGRGVADVSDRPTPGPMTSSSASTWTGTRRCWWSTRPSTADEVAALGRLALPALTRLPLSSPAALASDPASRARLWNTRKGLYAAVAGARPTGTTALLEDIVVPVPALLPTCERLIELFATARLRGQRHLRPRQGRQHPLHAQRAARGGSHGPPDGVHRRDGGTGAGVRRVAQGRARDGAHDGALRATAVRRRAARRDEGGQEAASTRSAC
jgi:D-lactate dehydrogenase